MDEFSIVMPVKDEKHLIPKTLPSLYKVNPSEVVLCFDKPAPRGMLDLVRNIAKAYGAEKITKIIEVERNPEYMFHQAWVRRKGFLEATYDKILTVDADLVINKNVLKAVQLVGRDDVGLVSCSKFRYPNGLLSIWRAIGYNVLRKAFLLMQKVRRGGLQMTMFTGLYALYRPYWLDSEDEEGIKKLVNPKQVLRGEKVPEGKVTSCPGEDTFLRDCMVRQHRVIYLRDIGAICLSDYLHDHPDVQFAVGRYNAKLSRSFFGAVVHTILYAHPHYLKGFIFERKRPIKNQFYSLENARRYWKFAPTSIGMVKTSSKDLLSKPNFFIKKLVERSIEERNVKEEATVYRAKISTWAKERKVKNMLDFGCGLGQDGVFFAVNLGVEVTFADIVLENVELTKRFSRIFGISAESIYIDDDPARYTFPKSYDLILAKGVLHHTPFAKQVVQNLRRFLVSNGLLICMLYTYKHFKATGARNLAEYAQRSEGFTSQVENPYSDFYDLEKTRRLFEGFVLLDWWTTHEGKFSWYVFEKPEV